MSLNLLSLYVKFARGRVLACTTVQIIIKGICRGCQRFLQHKVHKGKYLTLGTWGGAVKVRCLLLSPALVAPKENSQWDIRNTHKICA